MLAVARRVGRRDVHLKADAVNRHALRAQPSHEVVNAIGFLVQPLPAIIVVEEQRLRICLAGQAEGVGDVLVAEFLSEHRIPEPRPIVGNRLIHDVPGHDASTIMFRDRPDVVFECQAQFCWGERLDPARDRPMPDERVSLDLHAVRLAVRDYCVASAEGARSSRAFNRIPFHLVFGGEVIEMTPEHAGVATVAE